MNPLVGLFFGSFNPLHNGHFKIAEYLLDAGYCTEVWFVVSPQNPWKVDSSLLDEKKRLELVTAAIGNDIRMKAVDVEFSMPRPSYTYQTLKVLQGNFPNTSFALIIGGDNLLRFREWRNAEDILLQFPILVYPRPGVILADCPVGNVTLVDAPLADISSTEIRRKVKMGEDISMDVPANIVSLVKRYY